MEEEKVVVTAEEQPEEPVLTREMKEKEDRETLEGYRKELEKEKKVYMQKAVAYAINNRKARSLALGEAALQIMDKIRECSKGHQLLTNSLMYMLNEEVIRHPEEKRKEYRYTVMFQVTSNEKAWTKEEIDEKCSSLEERLKKETDELFPEEEANG